MVSGSDEVRRGWEAEGVGCRVDKVRGKREFPCAQSLDMVLGKLSLPCFPHDDIVLTQ